MAENIRKKIQLYRTAQSGTTASDVVIGELAMNYNSNSPFVMFKDNIGNIQKLGALSEVTGSSVFHTMTQKAITDAISSSNSNSSSQFDKIEASIGLAEDGSYVKIEGDYTSGATTIVGAIDDLDAALKSEESDRIAADNALQDAINAEASARTAADESEASARTAADNALQDAINAEASARTAADNALQTELDKTQTNIGLNADGTYTQRTDSNYINEATTVVGAINELDEALKQTTSDLQDYVQEYVDNMNVSEIGQSGSYISSVKQENGKLAASTKVLVDVNDDVLTFTENGITSTISIAKLTESEVAALGTNVKDAYKLIGKDSKQLGETIKIYKDQSLKSVTFDGNTQELVYTYIVSDGSESVVRVNVSAFLTEEEYGNGLQVIDHVISAKLGEDTATNKNFLDLEGDEEGKKSLAVRSVDTDRTFTTDRILVAGGPLDSTNLRNILPKDDSGNAYIEAGTDIQELLLNLFTKVEWPTPTITEGKINTTIAEPSFTLANSTKTVEVGTVCTLSEATLSTVSNATTARTCGEFTYGQSTSVNGAITKNKTISINASNIGVNGDNYTMTRDFTGFANTDDSATPSTNAADVKLASVDCVVVEGTNKVKITVKGPKGTCQFAEMPSYYVTSNIGTLSAEHMSPSKALATVNEDTTPSNSKELSVTGKYKYFLGYSDKTAYNQFDSASVRALTSKSSWITVDGTTTIVDGAAIESNGKSIVIACPKKYKLATIVNGTGANILPNFSSVGEVNVTTGSINTIYRVYVYPITNSAVVEFKNVTLTKA